MWHLGRVPVIRRNSAGTRTRENQVKQMINNSLGGLQRDVVKWSSRVTRNQHIFNSLEPD